MSVLNGFYNSYNDYQKGLKSDLPRPASFINNYDKLQEEEKKRQLRIIGDIMSRYKLSNHNNYLTSSLMNMNYLSYDLPGNLSAPVSGSSSISSSSSSSKQTSKLTKKQRQNLNSSVKNKRREIKKINSKKSKMNETEKEAATKSLKEQIKVEEAQLTADQQLLVNEEFKVTPKIPLTRNKFDFGEIEEGKYDKPNSYSSSSSSSSSSKLPVIEIVE